MGTTRQVSPHPVYPFNNKMIGFIINCIPVLLLISASLLLAELIRAIQQQHKGPRPGKSRPRKRIRRAVVTAPSSHLNVRLIQLLNGDNRAAARLIRHARRQNPRRSESWCVEKAIFDLERDRH
jgi:hypothetical protein